MGQRPNVILAEHAGFCFGVERAINTINETLEKENNVYAMGQVVHNNTVNHELELKGLKFEEDETKIPDDAHVILRAHGVPKRVYDYFKSRGIPYVDVACPFVKKIHKIVSGLDPEKDFLIIAGKETHAEVISIVGHAKCETHVVANCEELETLCERFSKEISEKNVVMVSQTTFSLSEWQKCIISLKNLCTNPSIFDTICKATEERQNEAEVLSKRCDRMIVIGAKHSSNTMKLFDVCNRNCRTCLVESVDDLSAEFLNGANTIGVTAGASTPAAIIKEVLEAMPEVENITAAEESFEALLEESFANVNNDSKVECEVVRITPTEIQVEITGRKQTGIITYEEYSYDPTVDPATDCKVGDKLNCVIMRTSDIDGIITLSKRRFDSVNAWAELEEAVESKTPVEGTVTDINKGGLIATTEKGIRVFVPGSLATVSRGESLDGLLKTKVKFEIVEVNKARRRAVGNIKALLIAERDAAKNAFWEKAEVGQTYTGVVKSLTNYGAFVDIGGVDGMIHITELSWKRIKHPSDVVAVGDTVEVFIKGLDDGKISLGYKRDEDNPWVVLSKTYEVGDVVDAKIVGMTDFGAFANIIPGIDGLVHISQIADRRIEKPQEVLTVGETVKAKITDIDYDKKRVSLSIRALIEPATEEAAEEEVAEEAAE